MTLRSAAIDNISFVHFIIYIYIYIITKVCRQHWFLWFSLAIHPRSIIPRGKSSRRHCIHTKLMNISFWSIIQKNSWIYLFNPSATNRIWHKVILAEYRWFEFSFPSPRLVALPRLENLFSLQISQSRAVVHISQTLQERRAKDAKHWWRNKHNLRSDILQQTYIWMTQKKCVYVHHPICVCVCLVLLSPSLFSWLPWRIHELPFFFSYRLS